MLGKYWPWSQSWILNLICGGFCSPQLSEPHCKSLCTFEFHPTAQPYATSDCTCSCWAQSTDRVSTSVFSCHLSSFLTLCPPCFSLLAYSVSTGFAALSLAHVSPIFPLKLFTLMVYRQSVKDENSQITATQTCLLSCRPIMTDIPKTPSICIP